jgi:hypothetical protein
MSGWFIAFLVFAVLAAIAFAIGALSRDKFGPWGTAALCTVLAVFALLIGASTIVPTKQVGIVVAFGKADDKPLENGWHWHDPRASVEKFDTTLQPLNLADDPGKDGCQGVPVRLGNQTTACADVTMQWHINGSGDVPELYRTYKSFEKIENDLVRQQLTKNVLPAAFDAYDPLAIIKHAETPAGAKAAPPAVTLSSISTASLAALQKAVGTGVTIKSLNVPLVHFDGPTEQRLKMFQQALADTRNAEQQKKTNEQTRLANEELARSKASGDEGVQFQNCLNFLRDMSEKNALGQLPPAFTCPGSGGANAMLQVPAGAR